MTKSAKRWLTTIGIAVLAMLVGFTCGQCGTARHLHPSTEPTWHYAQIHDHNELVYCADSKEENKTTYMLYRNGKEVGKIWKDNIISLYDFWETVLIMTD